MIIPPTGKLTRSKMIVQLSELKLDIGFKIKEAILEKIVFLFKEVAINKYIGSKGIYKS